MLKLVVPVAGFLTLFGVCVLQAATVAHGYAHHELAHHHEHLQDDGARISAQNDSDDHPHVLTSPQLPQRLETVSPALIAVPTDFVLTVPIVETRVALFWLEVRGPPHQPPTANFRPRSPPLA